MTPYTELQVISNFSFLRGGSHPEELMTAAQSLGYTALAITDINTLAGVVKAHVAAKKMGIRCIIGCRLDLLDGTSLLAYPTNKASYAQLSTLLTKGNLRTEKGNCHLYKQDVYEHASGLCFVILPPASLNSQFEWDTSFIEDIKAYKKHLGPHLYIAAHFSYTHQDHKRLFKLANLEDTMGIPLVATNDVWYHHPQRRALQDILTCIREKCTIHTAGYRLHPNAERYLKTQEEMHRLFKKYPKAIARTQEISDLARFSLDQLEYIYPEELTTKGRSPQEELIELTWKGAAQRFKNGIPPQIKEAILYELDFIARKNYASYFLTVFDFVRFARSKGILCQGRGSAANSVVCYCLGITSVDPSKFKLLFARFMSDARNEPPDIDVDFEHERREEVMQYIYNRYGRDRAGIVATVIQVHWKGAVRDVGKAMGLSMDMVDKLAKSKYEFTEAWLAGEEKSTDGLDASDAHLRKVISLTQEYIGFPRQLGQHTGGFVITQEKLTALCPIQHARMEARTCIEWNKDDIEALGFLKVDVLALGMLTCIKKAFVLIAKHYGITYNLATIPQDDQKVYDMISNADTLGVFQIESRAQMSMLPRMQPKNFYDLVIQVAIVRPGPIQGDMVHPYLRRRCGQEPVDFPSKELEGILGRTLGVPLFQEQAMEIAIVAAGFTPAEADGLRRSMATFKAHGKVSAYEAKLVKGMLQKGYEESFARRLFKQLEGFGSYGFPESHAASFALLVYVSSWIKCYYPDVFAAALLNSQPMGFYAPAQIIADARKHGVSILPVDINASYWDHTLEDVQNGHKALRLGFRQVKGLKEANMQTIVQHRTAQYTTINTLVDIGIPLFVLERLAEADAFRSIGLDRRSALWDIAALADHPIGAFSGQASESRYEPTISLPTMSAMEHVIEDYASTALSLKAHPVQLLRNQLTVMNVVPTSQLTTLPNGNEVSVCGLVTVRQRPATAKGVLFITVEDEFGFANLVVWNKVYEHYRTTILRTKLLLVKGRIQKEGQVIHIVVSSCHNLNSLLNKATINNQTPTQSGMQQATLFTARDFK